MFQSLFHVGDGVQHKAVTRCQTERDGGQEVHKALEHAAHVRRDVPRLDQRHVLWWYATLETAASGFIAARHVRKADGAFEGERWFDLCRNNKVEKYLNGIDNRDKGRIKQVKLFDSNSYLLPIPQTALDQNTNLVQNPGY